MMMMIFSQVELFHSISLSFVAKLNGVVDL